MSIQKIEATQIGNLSSATYSTKAQSFNESIYKDFWTVTERDTDGAAGGEAEYTPDWSRWHGYYRQVSIFAAHIDKKTSFTIGKGYEAKPAIKKILDKIIGWGKDDFNSILENQDKTAKICGDSFAEIIGGKGVKLKNLKPLNPGSMKIVVEGSGMLKGYKQVLDVDGIRTEVPFKKEDIFHLVWNRTANEIHGIPEAERMESTMKRIMEVQNDQRVMFHRYIVPVTMIPVKTSDTTEIGAFSAKYTQAYTKVEPMMVPDEVVNVKDIKHISIPQFSVHDPMPYLRFNTEKFAEDIGVPDFTGEKITEASAKIIYLAFQQTIERNQRWLEAQVRIQLGIEIDLEFPASIAPELVEDEKKDGQLNKTPNLDPTKKE
ncbi:hypothetical protein LCGC14_2184990 [marine sediment metagenome]|uniref:Portal protein n=1 Tax=marine sediment metagenome TaxID=412755 RepID=A0A0F9GH05_9ZZZZ|nr:hypothetical protein [Candidatus Pacearchaeota archaeon]